jgi:hypothetical protein
MKEHRTCAFGIMSFDILAFFSSPLFSVDWGRTITQAVIAGFPLGFDPRSSHVAFVVDKVALG